MATLAVEAVAVILAEGEEVVAQVALVMPALGAWLLVIAGDVALAELSAAAPCWYEYD